MLKSLIPAIQSEIDQLDSLILNCAQRIAASEVVGRLRISYSKEHPQYFLVTKETGKSGRYLKRAESNLIKQLAQQDYDRKVYALARRWRSALLDAMQSFPTEYPSEVYRKTPFRRELIEEKVLTDEEYVKDWQNQPYDVLVYNEHEKKFSTNRGEKVRSKSEKIIADLLYDRKIPYRYEPSVDLPANRYRREHRVYPDFVLLDVKRRREVILEHFGMVSKEEYANQMLRKMRDFAAAGYVLGHTLLVTLESDVVPFDVDGLKVALRLLDM